MFISRRKAVAFIGCPLIALSISGCGILTAAVTIRFKVRLYALVDGVNRQPETVFQSRWVDAGPLSQQGRWIPKCEGEALFLDLGHGRGLFGLLGMVPSVGTGLSGSIGMYLNTFDDIPGRNDKSYFEDLSKATGEHDLPPDFWPIFAYLPKLSDITGIRFLRPEETSAVAGIKIVRATIAVTQEPVSDNRMTQFPWFSQIGKYSDEPTRPIASRPPYQQLEPRNFRADGDAL